MNSHLIRFHIVLPCSILVLALFVTNGNASVFLSEYIEGKGNNKAIEIYNSGTSSVDLSNTALEIYFNGNNKSGRNIALSGILPPYTVYVIAHQKSDPLILSKANLKIGGTWFNGNDTIVLLNSGEAVDSFGRIGVDPGAHWGDATTKSRNNTLRRKPTACKGDTQTDDEFDPGLDWQGLGFTDFNGIGKHSMDCTVSQPKEITPIHTIQGNSLISPMVGAMVKVDAIVVGDFQGQDQLSGFFIQEQDSDIDRDPLTSEGLFVFENDTITDVEIGDHVRVSGVVLEYFQLTELSAISVEILGKNQELPTPAQVRLPFTKHTQLEKIEAMSIHIPQELTVTDNHKLGRYGEIWLSSAGRLMQPTSIAEPGENANAIKAVNQLNRILLDDGSRQSYRDPIMFPSPGLSATNSLRSGYTIRNIRGILDFAFDSYRIQPTHNPVFIRTNARTAVPRQAKGQLKIASMNVLNYFNGNGRGGGFPALRGASNMAEFQRQKDKIRSAISAFNADIIGIMEIENDGYDKFSAIHDLVNSLNRAQIKSQKYAFIDPGRPKIGSDDISVALLYRSQTVLPVGPAAILDSRVDERFNDTKNRPVIAQTFALVDSNHCVTVAVTHFKSKNAHCNAIGDPDTGDGQGNCNMTRSKAALALSEWLSTDPTHSNDGNFIIIGDLNAYAKEDPISIFINAGFIDLVKRFESAKTSYSYAFAGQWGYLDYALTSPRLTPFVTDTTVWHTNADEPTVLDYNTELKTAAQIKSLFNPDPFRASDHDPIVVSLDFSATKKTIRSTSRPPDRASCLPTGI